MFYTFSVKQLVKFPRGFLVWLLEISKQTNQPTHQENKKKVHHHQKNPQEKLTTLLTHIVSMSKLK